MNQISKKVLQNAIENIISYEPKVTTDQIFKETFECLLNIERDQFLGYQRGERSQKEIENKRNGYYSRIIKNLQGVLSIRVPRDRKGEFVPQTLELLKKSEEDLKYLGYQLYAKGMSTRDIKDVFTEVFEAEYSPQSISNMVNGFEIYRKEWQQRKLSSDYYFIYVDAIYTKIRRETVASEAIYVVIGLKMDLSREVLGIYSIPQESHAGWEEVFRDLKSRGLERFIMCIADGLSNMETALQKVYPKALLQKCVVHKIRRILLKVRREHKNEIADDLRKVFDVDNPENTVEEGKKRSDEFVEKWRKKYPQIHRYFDEETLEYYFQFTKFPVGIRRLLYSTNWIERLNKHLRKVEKNKNSFPNEESALKLLYMAVIQFEEKVYNFKVTSFLSSKDYLDIALETLYPIQTQNY